MKKTSLYILLIVALGLTILTACGGGSSSSSVPPQPATTAVLTLSTAVTGSIPANTAINSYDVTVTLPSGVTVMTMPAPNSSLTGSGVVTASGSAENELIYGVYYPATGVTPGKVKIYVESAGGFATGEFCKLSVTVAAGLSAPAANFNVILDDATGFDPLAASTILGLQSQLTVTIK